MKALVFVIEAVEARIQHAEDIIFWEGSKGAKRTLESLKRLEQGGHKDVTIKWDGSPAIIFGRDESGDFILTDKGGFVAKGYNGKAKSGDEVAQMILNRPGAKIPEKADGFKQLAGAMKNAFMAFEKAMPEDFRGYYKGDLLYFTKPPKQGDSFVFTPNIVTYTVKADSNVGKRIAQSTYGIVIHIHMDENGIDRKLTQADMDTMQGNEVLVIPPVTTQQAPSIDDSKIKQLESVVNSSATEIDKLLDIAVLEQLKMKDLSKIFYAYINSKVDTTMDGLGDDFEKWMSTSKVSGVKQARIMQHINENINGFKSMWRIVRGIQIVKDDIIDQFEKQDADVKATIGKGQGGEGYVLSDPKGDVKLVGREYFTKANRAVQR